MLFALPLVWAAAAAAGYVYSQMKNIPVATAMAALPAFLLEVTFYYALAIDKIRAEIEKLPRIALALGLLGAAVVPYVVASVALGSFHARGLWTVAALAAAASFWYVVLPARPAVDILFLLFMSGVWLARIFQNVYVDPHPKLPLDALGQLMWFRTGIFAMVSVRGVKGVGFGFWPSAREWKIGALYFIAFLPVAALLNWRIGFAKFRIPLDGWPKTTFLAVVIFLGVLWVLALGEEFFFRGLLQQWMTAWLRNEWAGLIAASLIFGSVHLWYRSFPNWRYAPLAALLGLACGLAFRQGRGIRASMVTHALVVTTWKIFFY